MIVDMTREERICFDAGLDQWERSLKRPDMSERDRVKGALLTYQRQAFAFTLTDALNQPEAAMSTDKAMVTGELAAHIHLIRVFAQDTNERNWADKRLYIMQQADRAAAEITRLQKELETAREDALEEAAQHFASDGAYGAWHSQRVASELRRLKDKEAAG